MSQPTARGVHIDRPLTNISVAYMQQASGFIASKVFPVVPVTKQSDLYRVYDKDSWFRDEAEQRAPGTESAGGGYDIGHDNYFAKTYAFHKDIADQDRDNADEDVDLDRGATEFVSQRLLLKREKIWVSRAFVPGVWANEVVGVAANPGGGQVLRWDDANSDPRNDVKRARRAIKATTGYMANTLVLHYDVMDALEDHPDLIERVKYTSDSSITEAMLARFFKVERVLVAGAIENKAKEGQAPAQMDFVFGKHAWLGYVTLQGRITATTRTASR